MSILDVALQSSHAKAHHALVAKRGHHQVLGRPPEEKRGEGPGAHPQSGQAASSLPEVSGW